MDNRIIKNRIQVLCLNPEVFYLHKMLDSACKMEDSASYGDSPFLFFFFFFF